MLYGMELRERVFQAVAEGGTIRAVSERFAVSPFFVKSMKKLHRETGSLAPRPSRAGRPRKLAGRDDEIGDLVASRSDVTLAQLREALNTDAAISTLSDTMRRLKLTFKKSRSGPPNRTGPTSGSSASSSPPTRRRWTARG